jgi:hypothetical protein
MFKLFRGNFVASVGVEKLRITPVAHSSGVVRFVGGRGQSTGQPGESRQPLDVAALVAHCPAMYGLNQICGICREIIR